MANDGSIGNEYGSDVFLLSLVLDSSVLAEAMGEVRLLFR